MFLETATSTTSFRIINSNLDTKINEVDIEVQQKSKLKKEYEDLKCTEYDEVLKKYIFTTNTIKKKKILFDRL